MNYKADTTLNERDSLYDILAVEKNLANTYSTVMLESCSKGFRNLIREHWNETVTDQLSVFLIMTELDYARVRSASNEQLASVKEQFNKTKHQLS